MIPKNFKFISEDSEKYKLYLREDDVITTNKKLDYIQLQQIHNEKVVAIINIKRKDILNFIKELNKLRTI